MADQAKGSSPGDVDGRAHRSGADDDITVNYADLINELRLLTTVSAFLFGFLLAVRPSDVTDVERWMFFGAILSVATATALFVLPIFYHRMQFPYHNWEKFQWRAHSFIMAGIPFLVLGFYLSLAVSIWDFVEGASFVVAALPIAAVLVVFVSRKYISPRD